MADFIKSEEGLILPKNVFSSEKSSFLCDFVFEPLENGYGVTIGNTLRMKLELGFLY